ncbi:MAG: YcaO-like family protein [Oligoflexia bacterium]|nr:YcaO-like family protein [Oligoflexia bacterium]MBF0364314.1 YcaO-like family protein [Oligoflexia bacterium]
MIKGTGQPIGKDSTYAKTIANFEATLNKVGIKIVIEKWNNPVKNVWSVLIRDRLRKGFFSNGKGTIKEQAYASALGEFCERLCTGFYFYNQVIDLDDKSALKLPFILHPNELWADSKTKISDKQFHPLVRELGLKNIKGLQEKSLIGREEKILALPYIREEDSKTFYLPMSVITNLYMSNGHAAGNTIMEAKVQALSEVFERAIKKRIIKERIALPEIPDRFLRKFPRIWEGICALKKAGYGLYIFDASLGGTYPLANMVLIDPQGKGVYTSYGAHPSMEVAIERTLTELLQGRVLKEATFFTMPIEDHGHISSEENWFEHFVDSSGKIAWSSILNKSEYNFTPWGVDGRDRQKEWDYLVNIALNQDLEILVSEYSFHGMNACHIIVPKFSEIYPLSEVAENNSNRSRKYYHWLKKISKAGRLTGKDALALLNYIERKDFLPDQLAIEDLIGNMQKVDFKEVTVLVVRLLLYLQLKKYKKISTILDEMRFRHDLNEWERSLLVYCELKILKGTAFKRVKDFYQHSISLSFLKYFMRPSRFFIDLGKIYIEGNTILLPLLAKRNL